MECLGNNEHFRHISLFEVKRDDKEIRHPMQLGLCALFKETMSLGILLLGIHWVQA